MRILTYLGIKEICEESIKAFSTAIASGALPQLEALVLGENGENGIGATGCTALADPLPQPADLPASVFIVHFFLFRSFI